MDKLLIPILFVALLISCKTNTDQKTNQKTDQKSEQPDNSSYEISFGIQSDNVKMIEVFEKGIIPWISIENPELEIENLIGKDEVVIKQSAATLVIDYPLEDSVEIEIASKDPNGFTKKELALIISEEYKRIYREEEESAQTKTIPREERKGLVNRNRTDGKYGIYGHDIGDLDLSKIYVSKNKDGTLSLELIVES